MSLVWPISRLGDVCQTGAGGTPLSTKKDYYEGGTIPWLVSGEVAQGEITSSSNFITQLGLERSSAKIFPEGTVLVAMYGATAGQVGILRFKAATNQAVCAILPNDKFLPKFMYYLLLSRKRELIAQAAGNAQPNISQTKIKNTVVPVPSLPEQRRIVAVLDEAFAGLATATANADKNLKNAHELFDSYLVSVFANDEVWEKKSLGDLCALFVDSAHRTPKYQSEGIPALRPRDVVNGRLSLSKAGKVSEQEYEIQSKRHRPTSGDIVYSRELSYGWAALLPEAPRICLSQGMCLFRPKPEISPSFLLHFLNGPLGRQQAIQAAVGAAHPHINLGDIKSYRIPVPTVGEQLKIVAELDILSRDIDRLATSYTDKLKKLSDLKESILQKAFSGKLTNVAKTAVITPKAEMADMRRDAALVIALAYERHKRSNRAKSLGHTKEQKILHMVEAEANFNLGRQPIRDAAGPNDFHHMLAAEEWAEANEYFRISERDGGGYQFRPLAQFQDLLNQAKSLDPEIRKKIEGVIDMFIPMDMQESEVFATAYAAWNNILIEGGMPTDDAIIAACYAWHPRKAKIPRAKFVEGLRKIRALNCIPDGRASFVPPPPQGQLPL